MSRTRLRGHQTRPRLRVSRPEPLFCHRPSFGLHLSQLGTWPTSVWTVSMKVRQFRYTWAHVDLSDLSTLD